METVLRVAILYLFILVGLRVLGKREFSQMSPMELVALLLIPEIASQGLIREDFSVTNAMIGVATLFVLVFANSFLTHLSRRFEEVVEGTPTVLVHDGRFAEANLNKERISPEEVYSELHKVGLERIDQVRWAILEGDGKIAVVPKERVALQRKKLDETTL